jgi:acyl-CoA hydrolase
MTFEERIASARTHTFKAVFPGETNHYDTLFGGVALQWMDEVAFIAATRFSREKVVTVTSDRVNFKTPIPSGSLVELDAQISKVGTSSIEVKVSVYKEDMYSDTRELALTGTFVMVAVGDDKKPVTLKGRS